MEFTIILNVLLFIGCYKAFGNWEIPFELGFDPFKVVGGFPTLIDSFFDDFFQNNGENLKNEMFQMEDMPDPILSTRFTRKLNWKCPLLEDKHKCFTVVTSSECLATSQLSFSFWENSEGNAECFYRSNRDKQCRIPFQRGNLCENVVVGIQKIENSTILELDDVMINTQIIQSYAEKSEKNAKNLKTIENSTEFWDICQNYTINEIVLAAEANSSDFLTLFPFGVNRTQLSHEKECTPPFPAGTFFCNCKNEPSCNIPVIYPFPDSTFCGSTSISIYHSNGFIYSAVVTSSEDSLTASEAPKHSVWFFDFPQSPPRSKYELQRGRFQCPSEVSCILEVFYPLSFFNSLEIPHQIGVLIASFLFGIAFLYGRNE